MQKLGKNKKDGFNKRGLLLFNQIAVKWLAKMLYSAMSLLHANGFTIVLKSHICTVEISDCTPIFKNMRYMRYLSQSDCRYFLT